VDLSGDDVPEWLRQDLSLVLRDLRLPRGVSIYEVQVLEDDDAVGGVNVSESGAPSRRLVFVADGLQEALMESRELWGTAQPSCRERHPHPAMADVVDEHAVWRCPLDGKVVARIGEPRIGAPRSSY
jgi:hypothetical protein